MDRTTSIGSGVICSGEDCGRVRIRIEATSTMMNTTPRMLIKMICWEVNFCPLSGAGWSGEGEVIFVKLCIVVCWS